MAQFTTKDGSALVSTLWPRGLPQFSKGENSLVNVHQLGQLVPSHEDGLRSWCYVALDYSVDSPRLNKFLAYNDGNMGEPKEIAFRFQGFVRDVQLGPYGTWSGLREDVTKAVQALTLDGGVARGVNNIQLEATTILRRHVVEELGGRFRGSNRSANQLKFMRPVFQRVKPTDENFGPSVAPTDELSNAAMKLRREWHALPGVRIAVQEQNTIRSANAREIRRGDFVEVLATVAIDERRRYNSKEVFVGWKPIHIVRLATAAVVRELEPSVGRSVVMEAAESQGDASHDVSRVRVQRVDETETDLF